MTLLSPQSGILSLFLLITRRNLPPGYKRVILLDTLSALRTCGRSLLRQQFQHPCDERAILLD
jgi:hypothetical protein